MAARRIILAVPEVILFEPLPHHVQQEIVPERSPGEGQLLVVGRIVL